MPVLEVTTNVRDVPQSFISKVSKEISTLTSKDEAKVAVIVNDSVKMSFGGSGQWFDCYFHVLFI